MTKEKNNKITLRKIIGHFNTVNKHRFRVFLFCLKCHMPIRGILHDLSKYSPVEFFESAKYYVGTHSPISECKRANGYSYAWVHHKNHNKHHFEYWYDYDSKKEIGIIPFKYVLESICDRLAAGMTYQGTLNTKEQLEHWNKAKKHLKINENLEKYMTRFFTDFEKYGVKRILNRKKLEKLYIEMVMKD